MDLKPTNTFQFVRVYFVAGERSTKYRVIFQDMGRPNRFAVVKLFADDLEHAYSIKFWRNTSMDKVASYWNMERLPEANIWDAHKAVDAAIEALQEHINSILTYAVGSN